MPEKKKDNLVLTTKLVKEIIKRDQRGEKLKNHEKLWFNNIRGVRKANITFGLTNHEIEEYMKCKMSVQYFSEKYAQIKLEDGSIGHMKLRDYQKDIIDLYTKNRFSILMASRQVGKCNNFDTEINILNEKTNETYSIPFFELYYDTIKHERKLTLLEKIKLFLYRMYIKLK